MKAIKYFLVFPLLLSGLLFAQDAKSIKKKHNVYDHGKIFKKAEKAALAGVNLRFKLVSRETHSEGSWKRDDQVTFDSWAVLNGLEESDFQEITEAFEKMWAKKLEGMGLSIVPADEILQAKNYEKLVEKNSKDRETVKKNWGIAKVFSAGDRDFFVYPMSPLGPHAKLAKELDALLCNMHITIDFAYIGFDVKRYGEGGYKMASGESTIYPVIRIEGMTENQLQVRTDGTYTNFIKDQSDAHNVTLETEISSDVEFAEKIESCNGCVPAYSKSGWQSLSNHATTGSYSIQADPALYKKAVLDALDKYTDELIILYKDHKK